MRAITQTGLWRTWRRAGHWGLCDNQAIFDEALNHFFNGVHRGDRNAVYYVHPDGLGQWQESAASALSDRAPVDKRVLRNRLEPG